VGGKLGGGWLGAVKSDETSLRLLIKAKRGSLHVKSRPRPQAKQRDAPHIDIDVTLGGRATSDSESGHAQERGD
jgi:hypothetical protein